MTEQAKKTARCVVCRRILGVRRRWRGGAIGDIGPEGSQQQYVLPSHINEFTQQRCGGGGYIVKADALVA